MRAFTLLLTFIAICVASPATRAQTFAFAAQLDDVDGPADGLFTFDLSLLDDGGAVLWSERQDSVIVADGIFALEVGANVPLPSSLPGGSRLLIVVDDDALDAVPLAQLVSVTRAARAARADRATSATTLAGFTAAQVATREAVAAAGGPPVAFGNVTGVPASVLDGDTGTDVTSTSVDLSISARTLNVATVAGSRIAAGSIAGSSFAGGSIGPGVVADGAVTGGKISDGTLPKSRFTGALTTREVKTARVFLTAAGCTAKNALSLATSCPRRSCTLADGDAGATTCDGSRCGTVGFPFNTCPTTLLGEMVLE